MTVPFWSRKVNSGGQRFLRLLVLLPVGEERHVPLGSRPEAEDVDLSGQVDADLVPVIAHVVACLAPLIGFPIQTASMNLDPGHGLAIGPQDVDQHRSPWHRFGFCVLGREAPGRRLPWVPSLAAINRVAEVIAPPARNISATKPASQRLVLVIVLLP